MADVILGSQSPRRRELLASVVGAERLVLKPPLNSEEAGFEGLSSVSSVSDRLREIVAAKAEDVLARLSAEETEEAAVVVADTAVVAATERTAWASQTQTAAPLTALPENGLIVLGKPEDSGPDWRNVMKEWLLNILSNQTHEVWTLVRVWRRGVSEEALVRTGVRFGPISEQQADWYIRTEESLGKAGGYAIQGYGAAFISGVNGSLTNVIGLPLSETCTLLHGFGIDAALSN